MSGTSLGLFEGFGVELEYMIVGRTSLDVLPVADRVLAAVAGEIASDVDVGPLSWSNELVLHVLELKTNGPARTLAPLPALFHEHVRRINTLLAPLDGRLMPGAMHPWMDPLRETRLWPHDSSPIYEAFDRVFDCRGHGWSNLQSIHVNLPFAGDEQFGRLHAAIRLVLPLIPALAAASPVVEGRPTGHLDHRLEVYRKNAARLPIVSGRVIPEPAFTRRDYEERIFRPLYAAIAPLDPEGILQHEWLNARGAIARFDRDTIEIRVVDMQECPQADLAVVEAVVAAVRALVEERWAGVSAQCAQEVDPLAELLLRTIREADAARIDDPSYLALFGLAQPCRAGEVWRHLVDTLLPAAPAALDAILDEGPLARRILRALEGGQPLADVYGELCACLDEGRMFRAP